MRRRITRACFSDDSLVATGGDDHAVKVWDTSPPEATAPRFAHADRLECAAISPGSQLIVSGSQDATLRVWNLASGEGRSALEGHTGPIRAVAWSPVRDCVVSGGADRTVRLWSAEDIVLFKLMYFRSKDRVDIEAVLAEQGRSLDSDYVLEWLDELVGPSDERAVWFRNLTQR